MAYTGWTIVLGILLTTLGIMTIFIQVFTSVVSVIFLCWMLIIGGIAEFFYGFFLKSLGRAFAFFLEGIFSFVTGMLIIILPGLSISTITLFICICMLAIGIYNISSSILRRYQNWGWIFAGGSLMATLGFIILAQWPVSGLWVIGLFIGIQLFVSGFSLMINAFKPALNETSILQDSVYFE
jgi:uncharacterized membrane protein HdeD (DUF308 family)